jgi:hypothetical protein
MSFAIAGATIGSALIGSDASRSASNKQLDAANASNALQKDMYDQTVARNSPFVAGGTTSFNALLDRLGLSGNTSAPGYGTFGQIPTAADVMARPGYQFGLDQGLTALNHQLNAHGMNYSGAQLKAINRFGNDYATSKYNDAFNQSQAAQQQAYNQLSGLAGMGQASANNTAGAGQQFASQYGSNLQGGANAAAANSLAQGNLWTNALNQGVSAYGRSNPTGTVGSGSTWFNDPTDASGMNATNGSDAGFYISDRRLKTNIQRIGVTPRGNAWYSWDWIDGSGSSDGVIAQEVQHIPGAVRQRGDGVLTVNYSKV